MSSPFCESLPCTGTNNRKLLLVPQMQVQSDKLESAATNISRRPSCVHNFWTPNVLPRQLLLLTATSSAQEPHFVALVCWVLGQTKLLPHIWKSNVLPSAHLPFPEDARSTKACSAGPARSPAKLSRTWRKPASTAHIPTPRQSTR